jgi:DNA-binding MurR/RpiR family transcriptional regulator
MVASIVIKKFSRREGRGAVVEDTGPTFQERYADAGPRLTPSEKKIGEYLLRNPDEVLGSSALRIAEATGTSDASVIRTVKGLGYQGLPELKKEFLGSVLRRRSPSATLGHNIDRIQSNKRPAEKMLTDSIDILNAFRHEFDHEAFDRCVDALGSARRIYTYGLGPGSMVSGFLALHLKRVGLDAEAMMLAGYRLADDLLTLSGDDAVVLVAPYHQTTEVEVVVDHAKAVGAVVVLVTEALGLSLQDRVDIVIKTPPTISNVVSEHMVPFVFSYVLTMQLASRQEGASVKRNKLFNELSARFTGSLDFPSPAFLVDETDTESAD